MKLTVADNFSIFSLLQNQLKHPDRYKDVHYTTEYVLLDHKTNILIFTTFHESFV